jgi:hypothetical protein
MGSPKESLEKKNNSVLKYDEIRRLEGTLKSEVCSL